MIKGAIFDVDGTILDSMFIWDELGMRYLETKGIEAEPNLRDKLFTMTMEEGAEYFKRVYGVKGSTQEIIGELNRKIEEFYCHEASLKPGVKGFLEGLQNKGVRLTVATATDRHLIEAAFARLNIRQYFSNIYTCSEVGAGKEQPRIYHEASASMKTLPVETLVFEDTLHAIYTCGSAGYKTVAVYDAFSEGDQEKMRQTAHLYLKEYRNFELFWQSVSDC